MKQFSTDTAKRYYSDYRKSEYSSFEEYLFDLIYTYPEAYDQIIDDKDPATLPSQVWRFISFCEEKLGKISRNF